MKENEPIPGAGIDLHRRPGAPMETKPAPVGNAHWLEPDRQVATALVLKRAASSQLTPVFSNELPPKGLSGLIRRLAYRVPEHKVSHWALLLLGDRVDALEHRFARVLPIAIPAVAAGALALFLVKRLR